MLRVNGMTMDDVEFVEFPYQDDWYDKPEMLDADGEPVRAVAEARPQARPCLPAPETALLGGAVDAVYTQSKLFQHLQEATGRFKMIEDLSRYRDWTLQVANTPAVITCTQEMADQHPELVVAFMRAWSRSAAGPTSTSPRRGHPRPADVLPGR